MTAKCIYCGAAGADHGEPSAYCDVLACRDRMRDRERRVVRVFWRVYLPSGVGGYVGRCNYESRRDAVMCARQESIARAGLHKVVRVTVRRKAKS